MIIWESGRPANAQAAFLQQGRTREWCQWGARLSIALNRTMFRVLNNPLKVVPMLYKIFMVPELTGLSNENSYRHTTQLQNANVHYKAKERKEKANDRVKTYLVLR